jgi:hypothetical protein
MRGVIRNTGMIAASAAPSLQAIADVNTAFDNDAGIKYLSSLANTTNYSASALTGGR